MQPSSLRYIIQSQPDNHLNRKNNKKNRSTSIINHHIHTIKHRYTREAPRGPTNSNSDHGPLSNMRCVNITFVFIQPRYPTNKMTIKKTLEALTNDTYRDIQQPHLMLHIRKTIPQLAIADQLKRHSTTFLLQYYRFIHSRALNHHLMELPSHKERSLHTSPDHTA